MNKLLAKLAAALALLLAGGTALAQLPDLAAGQKRA